MMVDEGALVWIAFIVGVSLGALLVAIYVLVIVGHP